MDRIILSTTLLPRMRERTKGEPREAVSSGVAHHFPVIGLALGKDSVDEGVCVTAHAVRFELFLGQQPVLVHVQSDVHRFRGRGEGGSRG